MTQTIWILTAAYVALGVLVLALNIRSGWPLWIRLGCIVLVSALYFVTWQQLQQIRGWPAHTALPPRFVLNASSVIEPDTSTHKPGYIYLWVTPIVNDQPTGTPRAFVVAYTRALHTELDHANDAMRSGNTQIGETSTPHAVNPQTGANPSAFAPAHQDIEIHDMPQPSLPEK